MQGGSPRELPAAIFKAISRRVLIGLIVAAMHYAALAQVPESANPAQQNAPDSFSQQTEPAVSSEQTLEQRGDLYMARKYFAEAAETYQKALLADSRNALLHNKLGIAYHQLLNYGPAKKSYRRAIQLNPRYAPAINNLAAVEYAQKHYRAAVLNYLKALKLTPDSAVVYSNLGTAYFALNNFEYAVKSYRFALQLDPQVFQHSGRIGSIIHQRDEKNPAAFNFYMAKTYADLHDVDNTVLYLRKAWEEGYQDIFKSLKDKAFDFLANESQYIDLVTQIKTAEAQKAQPASR